MKAKHYKISKAETWADVISCCRHIMRKWPGDRDIQLQCYMRERNGKMVLCCAPLDRAAYEARFALVA